MHGTIKHFSEAKGYGFVLPEDGGEDVFLHASQVAHEDKPLLRPGTTVAFERIVGNNGKWQAQNVRILSSLGMPAALSAVPARESIWSPDERAEASAEALAFLQKVMRDPNMTAEVNVRAADAILRATVGDAG